MSLGFDWPYALALLPLPLVIYFFCPKAALLHYDALKVPFFSVLKNIFHRAASQKKQSLLKWVILSLIWGLFIVSLSSPYQLGEPMGVPSLARNVLIALDTSESMSIKDMVWRNRYIDRMTMVKNLAGEFISHRQGERIGLILFGSNAYLQSPLTLDLKTLEAFLLETQIGLAGKQTAIGHAIGLSVKHFMKIPHGQRLLILITDGEDNASVVPVTKMVSLAKEQAVKIYTIGVGSPASKGTLDEVALKKIARETHGQYFRATDTEGLRAIFESLNQVEPVLGKEQWYQPKDYLYPYFLGSAFVLSLMMAVGMILTEFKYGIAFSKT